MLGLEWVLFYIDDRLVSSEDEQDIFSCLGKIFNRLEQHGFSLKQEKCKFRYQLYIEYLGYQINGDRIQPLLNTVDTIVKAPMPQNI